MIPDLTPAEIVRFYSKMQLTGCGLLWDGPVNNHGYGRFEIYRGGKRVRILAHRLSFKLATGEDPGSLVVRHQCDNPPCCTPGCFLLGTQADNIRDAVERARLNIAGLEGYRVARDAAARERALMPEKRCSGCKEVKPVEAFSRERRSIDGRTHLCRLCVADSYERRRLKQQRAASSTPQVQRIAS